MENKALREFFNIFLRFLASIISSIGIIVSYKTNKPESIPLTMILSIIVLLCINRKTPLIEGFKTLRLTKLITIIAYCYLGISLVLIIYQFEVDFYQLLNVVNSKSFSIGVAEVFNKKDYLFGIGLYYLSYASYLWDVICAASEYLTSNTQNTNFDVTASNIN